MIFGSGDNIGIVGDGCCGGSFTFSSMVSNIFETSFFKISLSFVNSVAVFVAISFISFSSVSKSIISETIFSLFCIKSADIDASFSIVSIISFVVIDIWISGISSNFFRRVLISGPCLSYKYDFRVSNLHLYLCRPTSSARFDAEKQILTYFLMIFLILI